MHVFVIHSAPFLLGANSTLRNCAKSESNRYWKSLCMFLESHTINSERRSRSIFRLYTFSQSGCCALIPYPLLYSLIFHENAAKVKNIWEDREFLRPRIPTTKKANNEWESHEILDLHYRNKLFKKASSKSKYCTFRKIFKFKTAEGFRESDPRPFLRYQVMRGGQSVTTVWKGEEEKSCAKQCPQTHALIAHNTKRWILLSFFPLSHTFESVACLGKQRTHHGRCHHDHGPPDLATSIRVLLQTPTSSSSLRCTIFGREGERSSRPFKLLRQKNKEGAKKKDPMTTWQKQDSPISPSCQKVPPSFPAVFSLSKEKYINFWQLWLYCKCSVSRIFIWQNCCTDGKICECEYGCASYIHTRVLKSVRFLCERREGMKGTLLLFLPLGFLEDLPSPHHCS